MPFRRVVADQHTVKLFGRENRIQRSLALAAAEQRDVNGLIIHVIDLIAHREA